MHKLSVLSLSAALTIPALALAGETVTAGDQSLKITAKIAPAKASKKGKPRGIALRLKVDYQSLNEGAQVTENTSGITVALPAGTKVNTKAAKQCLLSALLKDGASACPKKSRVGHGSATADARPTLPEPVPAEVIVFNGLDDVAPDGTPRAKPIPAVILQAETTLGVNATLPFDIDGSVLKLEYAPPAEGASQLFHINKVDVKFPNAGRKAYLTAPATCTSPWIVGMKITNFDGPSIEATHRVPCKKA